MSCPFCSMLAGGTPSGEVLFRGAEAVVMLSDWSTRGHAVVISTRHVENASELPEGEARGFFETLRKAEAILLRESGAARAILLKLGLQVPHLHLHIYPVSNSLDREGVFALFDQRCEDPWSEEERREFVGRVRVGFADGPGDEKQIQNSEFKIQNSK